MLLTIDIHDRRPIYRQIADGIKSLIAGGQLREGDPVPTVRQMAADLGVNLNTIATAYRELQDEGLVIVKHGRGATVASRAADRPNAPQHNQDELRRPLRVVLTELVLAGIPRNQILAMVNDELRGLINKG
jgi:GntR family transcriptional regulator